MVVGHAMTRVEDQSLEVKKKNSSELLLDDESHDRGCLVVDMRGS